MSKSFKETEIGPIPEEWEVFRLGDVADLNWGDTNTTKSSYTEEGFPAYSASGQDGFLDHFDYDREGVVLSAIGANCGDTWFATGKWSCIKNTIRFFPKNEKKFNSRFLFYVTQGKYHWPKRGSAQPFISQADARNVEIAAPVDINEQSRIASILSALDDKIELNRKINENLEKIASALFKRWFVDFEFPNEKGKPYKSSGGKMVESELGEIPEGWCISSFAETIEILSGGTPKTSEVGYWNGDIPWFSVVDAPQETDVFIIDTEKKITQQGVENSAAQILDKGITVITARGTVGKVGLIGVPMAINQSCYGLKGKMDTHGYFTYFTTRMLVETLQRGAHGSVFDTITRETFLNVMVTQPSDDLVIEFEKIIEPIMGSIKLNLFEKRTLTRMRDSLLPRLMNGRIRV
ncbi:restriction endonuclease subunit S [Patescibacteria group bacterium]|nr:restriction endonuclease subunit S [Patescibacteria group bacterium]